MTFKDALLQLSSYPEPTSSASVEQAVLLAEALGARISALTFRIEIPNAGNVLANAYCCSQDSQYSCDGSQSRSLRELRIIRNCLSPQH
jgi:hypothetical protein